MLCAHSATFCRLDIVMHVFYEIDLKSCQNLIEVLIPVSSKRSANVKEKNLIRVAEENRISSIKDQGYLWKALE